jgi:hypothetical protein
MFSLHNETCFIRERCLENTYAQYIINQLGSTKRYLHWNIYGFYLWVFNVGRYKQLVLYHLANHLFLIFCRYCFTTEYSVKEKRIMYARMHTGDTSYVIKLQKAFKIKWLKNTLHMIEQSVKLLLSRE